MNGIDRNLNPEYENEKVENRDLKITLNSQFSTPNADDDRVVFVPVEEIRAIESIYNKMNQAQQEFRKVAEQLRDSIDSIRN